MTFVNIYNTEEKLREDSYSERFLSRNEEIKKLKKLKNCDIVIAGGGIHGAALARLAAFNGLSVTLLERSDYAAETSSRSSKMAHGGLRYLELYDFRQVLDGIKGREFLYASAPHLVKPIEFFFPYRTGSLFERFKLKLGFAFYDFLKKKRKEKHREVDLNEAPAAVRGGSSAGKGGVFYSDGLMNDCRLVIENIVAARQEGAVCLNHASVVSYKQREDGRVVVGINDELGGQKLELETGVLVNCCGPWTAHLGRITPRDFPRPLRFSQGSHLVFDKPWDGPALVLPLPEKTRYYFVWPYKGKTLVGTTERELAEPVREPLPKSEEISEILANLKRDLPEAKLTKDRVSFAFAGIRTLPAGKSGEPTAKISRRPYWHFANGMLSLIGGKFTSAEITALEGLKIIFKLASLRQKITPLFGRRLPGGAVDEAAAEFTAAAQSKGISQSIITRVVETYGSRTRFFLEDDKFLELIGGKILRGEIEICRIVEQAETLEDFFCRRAQLDDSLAPDEALLDSLALEFPQDGSKGRILERASKIRELINAAKS